MITKYGDIFQTDAKIIGHGVNCKGKMGAGIAVLFAKRFGEEMLGEYESLCEQGILIPGQVHPYMTGEDDEQFDYCFNIASQNNLGKDAKEAWLTAGLIQSATLATVWGYNRIAIPAIGCGIGGLHLDALERAIAMAEDGSNTQFELWLYE